MSTTEHDYRSQNSDDGFTPGPPKDQPLPNGPILASGFEPGPPIDTPVFEQSLPYIPAPPPPISLDNPIAGSVLKHGRYRGGNDRYVILLRLDAEVSQIISGELFHRSAGDEIYIASFRTLPGSPASLGTRQWNIIAEHQDGSTGSGELHLDMEHDQPDSLHGKLLLNDHLEGLPQSTPLRFLAEFRGHALRHLGIEIESERDVPPPPVIDFQGRPMSIETALQDAGFEIHEAGTKNQVPTPPTPWGVSQLHALMNDLAQSDLREPAWELRLLWLAHSSRKGLLGVMFDNSDSLPRQGLAVFAETIRNTRLFDADRKLIQTTVHEIGHTLNLVHRFERIVGRANSTSFMNYDWKYLGEKSTPQFWKHFQYRFDPDELEFLNHGPRHAVIPGGRAFHEIRYWADGTGGSAPYNQPVPNRDFELRLIPPENGTLFEFGQPVFLGIELRNASQRTVSLPEFFLDVKAGFLEIAIRRTGISERPANTISFHSIMTRLFDHEEATTVALRPGRTIKDNIHLTFGSGGFSFAEPGNYEITAHIVIPDRSTFDKTVEWVSSSAPLKIRVAFPQSREDENDAFELLSDDAGSYLMLGGNAALDECGDRLAEIATRRSKKNSCDAIAVAIKRCQGIDQGRSYLRYQRSRFVEKKANPKGAATTLGALNADMLRIFDPVTKQATMKLARKQAEYARKK